MHIVFESLSAIPPGHIALLSFGGFAAGLIDSVVGGGGLISVPIFLLILGPNAGAVASNKVAAVAAQVAAFSIYWRSRQVDRGLSPIVLLTTAVGSIIGALLAPLFPRRFFEWFILVIAPLILALVFSKSIWTERKPLAISARRRTALAGGATFVAGLYDGVAGPGGGTLMFLSLFLIGGLPAPLAIGTGKLANLGSASTSLATYAYQGEVNWLLGSIAALPIALGAWLGARYCAGQGTTANATALARTALLVISVLLLIRWASLIV